MRGISRRWLIVVVAILVVMTMTAAGCGNKKGDGPGAPEVAVVTLAPEKVPIVTELPGRISAFLIAEVRPQVTGIIKKRLFTEGGDVKAGQALYEIDPAPYQAAFDNASASLARAEANLPPIRAKAQRYKELVAIKAVSQQEFDDVTGAHLQAEADVKYWKAAVETARINLGYTRVAAPISGRIGKSSVTVGALATANQPAAFTTIQQLDPIYVDVTQPARELLALRRAARVQAPDRGCDCHGLRACRAVRADHRRADSRQQQHSDCRSGGQCRRAGPLVRHRRRRPAAHPRAYPPGAR